MIEEQFISLISNVGFPIAITCYFMFKGTKIIENNTAALQELRDIILNK